MSVDEAKNLINLNEMPSQTGGDGFSAPTSMLTIPMNPEDVTLADNNN